ncbi:MAG: lantibiotic dehydratase, partial [Acidimicrobiales bacterium]
SDEIVHIAALPDTRAQNGRRTWLAHELEVDGIELVDPTAELRVPLLDVFSLPLFVAGVRSFQLLPEHDEHAPRISVGRTVLRRETWNIPATDIPERPEDLAAFGRERAMPRRVFVKSPLERKPMYLDLESRILSGILCRHARQAAAQSGPQTIRFTEMLPTPDQCWLSDPDGNRYAAELRLVAVDASR